MIGLVVATHGRLAEELISTAEQIVGKLEAVAACSIEPGASPDDIRDQVKAAVASVDSGDGVIVMADLFGGTPCNQSLSLCGKHDLEVLTGVNLPMLLKASSLRAEAPVLAEMASALAEYGQKNITRASALVRPSEPVRPHH
jgi:PTS system mannose-specific IIA component